MSTYLGFTGVIIMVVLVTRSQVHLGAVIILTVTKGMAFYMIRFANII